jgi:hypothetical protein
MSYCREEIASNVCIAYRPFQFHWLCYIRYLSNINETKFTEKLSKVFVRGSLYTHLVLVGLSVLIHIEWQKIWLHWVTASGNGWQRNIYSGTVVCSRVLDIGVRFAEIMDCSLTHPQYEKPSYLQTCEFSALYRFWIQSGTITTLHIR